MFSNLLPSCQEIHSVPTENLSFSSVPCKWIFLFMGFSKARVIITTPYHLKRRDLLLFIKRHLLQQGCFLYGKDKEGFISGPSRPLLTPPASQAFTFFCHYPITRDQLLTLIIRKSLPHNCTIGLLHPISGIISQEGTRATFPLGNLAQAPQRQSWVNPRHKHCFVTGMPREGHLFKICPLGGPFPTLH